MASLSRRVVSGIICSQSRKISSCRVRHVVMAYLLPDVPLVPALVDIVFHAHSLLIGLLLVQTQFLVQSAVSVIITYRCTTPVLIVSCRFSVCTSLPMASRDRNARGTSTFHVFRCGAHGKWPLPPHLQPFWSCSQLCIFVAVAGALAFAATSLCGSSFLACPRRHHDDGTSIVQHMDGIKLRQAQHSLQYVRSNSYRFHVATLSTIRR